MKRSTEQAWWMRSRKLFANKMACKWLLKGWAGLTQVNRERMITDLFGSHIHGLTLSLNNMWKGIGLSLLHPQKLVWYLEHFNVGWTEQSQWMIVQSMRSCQWVPESLAMCRFWPQGRRISHHFFTSFSPLGFPLFKLWLSLSILTTLRFSEDLPKFFPQLLWDNSK